MYKINRIIGTYPISCPEEWFIVKLKMLRSKSEEVKKKANAAQVHRQQNKQLVFMCLNHTFASQLRLKLKYAIKLKIIV